ncbi:MAG: redoxin domain-containing protein [Actinobacteria bacterium]|nr:redoxin domain-containing protein [Actinomycetota bacterium]
MDAVILGVSFDTREENAAFAEEFDFPFPLLCDTDREVSARFGAARPDDDPAANFARRVSYLIDPSGTVRRAYEVTDIPAHPGELLDDLRALREA